MMLGMSVVVLLVVGGACLAHVALCLVALVMLVRTPRTRLRMAKWLWALVIIFGHTVGPIAFLVVGRQSEEDWAPAPPAAGFSGPAQRF